MKTVINIEYQPHMLIHNIMQNFNGYICRISMDTYANSMDTYANSMDTYANSQ